MKKYLFPLLLIPMMMLVPAVSAFAETGQVSNGMYTFEDRNGNIITVPVEAFAAEVINFAPGYPWTTDPDNIDPQITLGLPDSSDGSNSTGDLCLGYGGSLVLRLGMEAYDGYGNDIYIFEVGGNIEDTKVEVSSDLQTWYEIGIAKGRTDGLDFAGKVPENMGFQYVRVTDYGAFDGGDWPGADIDAVCGLNVRPVTSSSSDTTGNSTGNNDNNKTYTFEDRNGKIFTVPVGAFADRVMGFEHGDPWTSDSDNQDPNLVLGLPDSSNASNSTGDLCLGDRGRLIVRLGVPFFDGPGNDVYIFEVGPDVEQTKVYVSSDLENWYFIGMAEGRTAGLDLAGEVPEGMTFYYVGLIDGDEKSSGSYPGADIDAVCALNTR